MADGGGGGIGKYLAGCGCLTWLGCMFLSIFLSVGWGFVASLLPADLVSMIAFAITPVSGLSGLCGCLGFFVGLVGIVMIFMGGGKSAE
jgi:hypothetical protein